jgi:hypothetical protein
MIKRGFLIIDLLNVQNVKLLFRNIRKNSRRRISLNLDLQLEVDPWSKMLASAARIRALCDKEQAGCQKLTQKSREFLGTSDHISTHFNQREYNFVCFMDVRLRPHTGPEQLRPAGHGRHRGAGGTKGLGSLFFLKGPSVYKGCLPTLEKPHQKFPTARMFPPADSSSPVSAVQGVH